MSEIQSVFNIVIEKGYYSEDFPLMCYALENAFLDKVINSLEYSEAKNEIKNYLKAFGSLGGLLLANKLDYAYEDRLSIYLNWADKPDFTK